MTGSRFAAACAVSLIAAAPLALAQGDKSANRAKLSQPAPVNPRQTGNNTFQFALANGMQVLVIPDHRAPVATQMLWFKVGAVDDPADLPAATGGGIRVPGSFGVKSTARSAVSRSGK